jgi:hypothetical protein
VVEYGGGDKPFANKRKPTRRPPKLSDADVATLRSLPGTAILTSREAAASANIGYARITLALRHGLLRGTRIEGRLGYRVTVRALAAWIDSGAPIPAVLSDDDKAALMEVQETGRPDLQGRPDLRAYQAAEAVVARPVRAAPAPAPGSLPPAAEAHLALLAALPLPPVVVVEDLKAKSTFDGDTVAALRQRMLQKQERLASLDPDC